MAETQCRTPGVIRSTRDYIRALTSPMPASPESDERAPSPISTFSGEDDSPTTSRENPREIRNRAEKQRRDKLNSSIAELASMVPPVLAASRKIDKTGVLRLTAHYLRSHQYVFGDSIGRSSQFTAASARALLSLLNGFLLTTTYKGLIVVVSQNVAEYLGYTELELLGQNILNFTHEDDREKLKQQLMPRSQKLGSSGELLMPDDAEGRLRVEMELANEKRKFTVRLKKLGQRSGPSKYVTCHVEGSLRKSDRACGRYNRCCPMLRRARARGDNPCSSGNDVVFIGVVRPTAETFMNECAMETYKMEYRTRHSVDGEIIQCEQRIALVTGYMTHEVRGVNAMNFIHRDEVRCVILALRAMYENNHLFGESCYRLMTKTGQLTYMRTRGRLEVDAQTRAVTSFVCTNTVVEEPEGKHLIQIMKEKYRIPDEPPIEDVQHNADNQAVPVEDPKQLEKDIMRLVTDLPPPEAAAALAGRFAIIPPMRERIISAIEKIYTVFNYIPKKLSSNFVLRKDISPTVRALVSNPQGNYDLSQSSTDATDSPDDTHTPDGTYTPDDTYTPEGTHTSDGTYTLVPSEYLTPACVAMTPYTEEMRFQMFPPQEPAMPGPSVAGVKRSSYDIDGQETSTKKKVINVSEERDASAGRVSPSLESFFDEAILNTQIESALNSLEHTIDLSFPDLLIANEVQEILGQIESDANI